MKTKTSFLCFFLCLFFVANCASCSSSKITPKEKIYYDYFDTVSYVYSYSDDTETEFEYNAEQVSKTLEEYHKLFDIYNEYEGINNLCTVNKNAGNNPTEVDKKLIDFMLYCKQLYNTTNGKVNVMLGSVLSLWHQGKTNKQVPEEQQLKEANQYTDISLLEIDEKNKTLYIKDKNSSIDVGAIGKGYATELAANSLERKGVEGYVLNIGGNVRIIGTKPDGNGWVTGIKNPNNTSEISQHLYLSDTSCVTSGSYERFFTVDNKNYHHIIDPLTLMPSEFFPSVTVVTKHSGLADALSTALFCMNYKDGLALIDSIENTEALWITFDGQILYSKNMKSLIYEE